MTTNYDPLPPKWYLSPRYLIGKLRERGIIYCLKLSLNMAYNYHFIPSLKFLLNLVKFLFNRKPRKVLLGVWDYKLIPWSVGDFLVFIETLSVLKLERGADKVDICVVCDSENPAGNRGYTNINSSNFRYYLFNLLPIINTSPYLGSVFQFDTRSEFHSFLKQNLNKYEIYPPVNQQLKETFNFIGSTPLKEVQDFYRERGFIPYLAINDYHLYWAYDFYRTRAQGLLPVVVSLRHRPDWEARNADRDIWLSFFDLCKSEFPEVVFVVVGIREEVFDELRQRSNVIIAKDHGSTLSDDFALVKTSLLYMGVESGIGCFALFSDTPYLLFDRPLMSGKRMGLETNANFAFATQHQKVFYSDFVVTPDSLLREFTALYSQLNTDEWRKKASAYESILATYASVNFRA